MNYGTALANCQANPREGGAVAGRSTRDRRPWVMCSSREGSETVHHQHLQFGQGFRVVFGDDHSQAAQMTLATGTTEGGPDNRHRGAGHSGCSSPRVPARRPSRAGASHCARGRWSSSSAASGTRSATRARSHCARSTALSSAARAHGNRSRMSAAILRESSFPWASSASVTRRRRPA